MNSPVPLALRYMLSVETLQERRGAGDPKFVAPVLALLNLFFLAYFERYLAGERSAETLALLLFLEVNLFVVLALTRFLGGTELTLKRSAVFPTTAWERFLFAGISNLRRPVVGLWLGSVVLAFVALGHSTWVEAMFPPILFSALVVCVQALLSLLLLATARREGAAGMIVWALLASILGIAIASLLFGEWSLMRFILPVQWVADAIRALHEGNLQPTLRAAALLLGLGGGALLLVRRVC